MKHHVRFIGATSRTNLVLFVSPSAHTRLLLLGPTHSTCISSTFQVGNTHILISLSLSRLCAPSPFSLVYICEIEQLCSRSDEYKWLGWPLRYPTPFMTKSNKTRISQCENINVSLYVAFFCNIFHLF